MEEPPYRTFSADNTSNPQSLPATESNWSKYIYSNTFQNLLDMEDSLEKFTKLSLLAEAFVTDAKHLGRIIIEERDIPNHAKSLKPQDVGGIAGGEKFIEHGILFKYCKDIQLCSDWIYGEKEPNHEGAIKAGGLELKGINAFFSCGVRELCVPFIALVDFRGFRLSAISFLPISPTTTLLYGSADAGKNFKSNAKIHELMSKVGDKLNLKEHTLHDGQTKIIGPIDIEIHHSAIDGRFYVLDFARLMPPEPPTKDPNFCNHLSLSSSTDNSVSCFNLIPSSSINSVFYYHLRPELVKSLVGIKLCSDSFSKFLFEDEQPEMNKEVEIAYTKLHENIHKLSNSIKKSFDFAVGLTESPQHLCYQLHQNGINLRYLGLLRALISCVDNTLTNSIRSRIYQQYISLFFLQEMVARAMKCEINKNLRKIGTNMDYAEKPLEEITKMLNYIASPKKNIKFWQVDIKKLVLSKFGPGSLTEEENNTDFPLCFLCPSENEKFLDRESLMERLTFLCNWNIKSDVYSDFKKYCQKNKEYEFLPHDIEEMNPKVKYMGFIDYVAGRRELELVHSSKRGVTRLQFAVTKLQDALSKCHDNEEARNFLIRARLDLLRLKWDPIKLQVYIKPWLRKLYKKQGDLPPFYKLLYVEGSILTSLSQDNDIIQKLKDTLFTVDSQFSTKWTTDNFEGLWKVSKYSFEYFHKMLFTFSDILRHKGLLWSYVACCLYRVPVDLVDISPVDVKNIVDGENVEIIEIVSRDLSNEEGNSICQCIDVILQLEKNFNPVVKCGIRYSSWKFSVKEDSKNYWCSYDKDSNKILEKHYQEDCNSKFKLSRTPGMNKVLTTKGYEIDLEKKKQVNILSGNERNIKREPTLKDLKYVSWLFVLWRTHCYLGLLLEGLGNGIWKERLQEQASKLEKLALAHFNI